MRYSSDNGQAVTHSPRYKYDCGKCKFNWNCGYLSRCVLNKGRRQSEKLSEPPIPVQEKVNFALVAAGYESEFLLAVNH